MNLVMALAAHQSFKGLSSLLPFFDKCQITVYSFLHQVPAQR